MTPTQYAALITSHLRLQLRDAYQRSLAWALGIDPVALLVKATRRADADRG